MYASHGSSDRLGFNVTTGVIDDGITGVTTIAQIPIDSQAYHIIYGHAAANDWKLGFDGGTAASTTTNTINFSLISTELIGATKDSVYKYQGNIAETIEYDRVLTATERQKVDSYLAIKYGLTLGTTASTINYLNSAGTTIWSGNATYQNRVFGVARDDASGLHQKQAKATGKDSIVTLGVGAIAVSNAANAGGFGVDLSALLVGDNNGSMLYSTYTGTNTNYKMARVWKVHKTGTVAAVLLQTSSDVATHVLVSTDATFATATTEVPIVDGLATLTLSSGQFFTLASSKRVAAATPGGVTGNLQFWLKADAGVSGTTAVSAWANQYITANDVTNATAASQPTLVAGDANFNPSITFTSDFLKTTGTVLTANSPYTKIAVLKTSTATPANIFGSVANYNNFYSATSGTDLGIYHTSGALLTATGAISTAKYYLGAAVYSNTTTANSNAIRVDGAVKASNGTTSAYPDDGGLMIGAAGATPASFFDGNIAEALVFNATLSAANLNKIETYLAIKYGISLGTTTTPVDYISSNGTTFWTGNSTYQNRVFGIGRDDASALNQKQAQAAGDDSVIQIGLGAIAATNAANAATFDADMMALMVGDNNGLLEYKAYSGTATTYKMARTWKVQKTNTVGSVVLHTSNRKATHLLVSTSPTFASGVTEYPLVNGDVSVSLSSGQYFTLGTNVASKSPGGVTGNLLLWPKADAGVTGTGTTAVSTWANQYNDVNNVTNPTAASQPVLVASDANFNPSIAFTSDFLKTTGTVLTANSPYTKIAVLKTSTTTTPANIFGSVANYNNFYTGTTGVDLSIYHTSGALLTATGAISTTRYYLTDAVYSNTTAVNSNAIRVDGAVKASNATTSVYPNDGGLLLGAEGATVRSNSNKASGFKSRPRNCPYTLVVRRSGA